MKLEKFDGLPYEYELIEGDTKYRELMIVTDGRYAYVVLFELEGRPGIYRCAGKVDLSNKTTLDLNQEVDLDLSEYQVIVGRSVKVYFDIVSDNGFVLMIYNDSVSFIKSSFYTISDELNIFKWNKFKDESPEEYCEDMDQHAKMHNLFHDLDQAEKRLALLKNDRDNIQSVVVGFKSPESISELDESDTL